MAVIHICTYQVVHTQSNLHHSLSSTAPRTRPTMMVWSLLSPRLRVRVMMVLLLVLMLLDTCLAQLEVLTDLNFKDAIAQCVGRYDGSSFVDGEDPVNGNL
eukprot:SAG22_NODE_7052_length_781_cov_2.021994_2_plen_101_part_00